MDLETWLQRIEKYCYNDSHNLKELQILTDFLSTVKPTIFLKKNSILVTLFLLSSFVDWLDNLRQIDISQSDKVLGAVTQMESIMRSFNSNTSTICDIMKHLKTLQRVASSRQSIWVSYVGKLKTSCNAFVRDQLNLLNNMKHLKHRCIHRHTPVLHQSETDVAYIPIRLIQRYIFGSTTSVKLPVQQSLWKNKVEESGILCIIRNIAAMHREKPTANCSSVDESTRDFYALFCRSKTLLCEIMEMYQLYAKRTVDSTGRRQSVATTLNRRRTSSSSSESFSLSPSLGEEVTLNTPCKRSRPLLSTKQLQVYHGTVQTPPGTPFPAPVKTGRIEIPESFTKNKRIPWTIMESITLWHGVTCYPGSQNWSVIWRQSFRQSGRSQVDLKDRWRTIQRRPHIKKEVESAYQSWVSDNKEYPRDYEKPTDLPVPVIVRSMS